MSPYELEAIPELEVACKALGWVRYSCQANHERDSECSWVEEGWEKDGVFLIADSDLSEGMAREIMRIAKLIALLKAEEV